MEDNSKIENSRIVGKINLKPLEKAFGEIQTDEVIITNERAEHILERHREDYDFFLRYAEVTVTQPDIIIKDHKNVGTVFMVKKISDTNVSVVVRLVLSTDNVELKNSIMTFYRLRDKNLNRLMKKNEILYKIE